MRPTELSAEVCGHTSRKSSTPRVWESGPRAAPNPTPSPPTPTPVRTRERGIPVEGRNKERTQLHILPFTGVLDLGRTGPRSVAGRLTHNSKSFTSSVSGTVRPNPH